MARTLEVKILPQTERLDRQLALLAQLLREMSASIEKYLGRIED